ncbi:MAG: hypothetical protein K9L78_05425 [Victivallales bacterium]|nr:hypothetical protein [Victivallales bacterium]MCF7889542.1 hypothetical protein [Victivallales bacterium]
MKNKDINKLNEEQLVTEINRHNKLYWEKNSPEISDEEYDLLIRRLEEINPEHELLRKYFAPNVASIGQVKTTPDTKMISLEKTYFFDNAPKGKKSLMSWAEDRARDKEELFYIQPKYDGISANYDGNILATRGQDSNDQNVSDKIPLIELETKGYKGPLDRPARGEIVIRDDDFKNIYKKIKRKSGTAYKNSRNAVAGIMGLKDISEIKAQGAKLTLVDYNLISYSVKYKNLKSKWPEILKNIESLPYPMDGIVVKLADSNYSKSLGETAAFPRGMIAFKLAGARKKTTLKDVAWSSGKNNLTPKGVLQPVELGGVTISNVTLHNYQYLLDRDIRIGDTLTIERAGEVIPHVVNSEPGTDRISPFINECPSCSSKVEVSGVELRCTNPLCPEKIIQRLCAAVKALGIEELGEPTIRKMTKVLGVKNIKDILTLTLNDIYKLEGFKEKSATKLYNNIQNAKRTTDYQFFAALNIAGLGQTFAKSLLKKYTFNELRQLSAEQLAEIDQVGPTMSESIYKALREKSVIIDELLSLIDIENTKNSLDSVSRPTVCFTGKMPEKRSYYEKLAEENGYSPVDKVTKELDTLVVADINSNSSKIQKARKMGIKIIQLDSWLSEIEEAEKKQYRQETL